MIFHILLEAIAAAQSVIVAHRVSVDIFLHSRMHKREEVFPLTPEL